MRLALWYVAVTLASFAAVAIVFALRTHAWVEEEGQRSAESVLQQYRKTFEIGGAEALRAVFHDGPHASRSIALRLTDASDVEILQIASDGRSERVAATLRAQHAARESPVRTPAHWHVAVTRVSSGRALELLAHDDDAPRLWRRAREILWLILACAMASAIAGAFVISRRALQPLAELARATQRIIESGDLGQRVAERDSDDDLDQLAKLFNRMLARTATLVRAMKESLDNVAHDLRTPLARLRAGAELALREPAGAERAKEALADVIEEVDRVLGTLTTLMDITGAETGAMRLDKHVEDLSSIASEAIALYDDVASERDVKIVMRLQPNVDVVVDRQRILQVCANLLDNALKYTRAGGDVEVTVASHADCGVISFSDNGIGIAPEDQPRVRDRLFRADRSRAQHGLGLGLSLVKAIVEAHAGQVELRSELGVGSTFEVRLPRARPVNT